jgi:hypothetical protein
MAIKISWLWVDNYVLKRSDEFLLKEFNLFRIFFYHEWGFHSHKVVFCSSRLSRAGISLFRSESEMK